MKTDIEKLKRMYREVSAGIPELEKEIAELKVRIANNDPNIRILKEKLRSAKFLLKTDKHTIETCQYIFRGHDKGLVLKWVRPA
jgi:uncharacterized coiled-coil DUF342 family protein